MTDNHPITPPQWQVDAWCKQALAMGADVDAVFLEAARWGADQELEACCEWCADGSLTLAQELRAARRPKPPSLARQAMEAQQRAWKWSSTHADWELIRAALERLQELEKGNE